MRHGKKDNHLGRTASHRHALLSNMANSLILHKRIETTVAKAKELRKYVEPLLTRSKEDTTHNRRIVFSYLKNKEAIKALFGEVSEKIANRNGGYTRIIKLGTRQGDAAETAFIELVDYNDILLAAAAEAPAKSRRTRRGSKKVTGSAADTAVAATAGAAAAEESPAAEAEMPAAETETPAMDSAAGDVAASEDSPEPETDNPAPGDEPEEQA
jgi:large subunit ribosomal protein L17